MPWLERNLSRTVVFALLSCCVWAARAEPLGCLIEPDRVAEVGSQAVGVLDQVRVERGDAVHEGQILARLSTEIERASVAVAETRAQAEAEVRGAEAAAVLAQRKLQRARELVQQHYVSDQALDQALAEARVAEERARQAREARQVASRELQLSSAQLGQRFIRSPFEGIVVERYHTQGERIEREPVVKIAKIDPLRIEVIVPATQFGSIRAGQVAPVTPQLQQFGTLQATVTLVDRVIDAASNSFRVRLALPNPEHRLPSGLRCSVDFAQATMPSPAAAVPERAGKARSNFGADKPAAAPALAPAGATQQQQRVRPVSLTDAELNQKEPAKLTPRAKPQPGAASPEPGGQRVNAVTEASSSAAAPAAPKSSATSAVPAQPEGKLALAPDTVLKTADLYADPSLNMSPTLGGKGSHTQSNKTKSTGLAVR